VVGYLFDAVVIYQTCVRVLSFSTERECCCYLYFLEYYLRDVCSHTAEHCNSDVMMGEEMTAQHSTAEQSREDDGRERELAVPSLFLHPHFISFLFFLLDFFPSSWLSFRVLVPCSISSTPKSSTHCQLSFVIHIPPGTVVVI
jgi:hypothetical protein